MQTEIDTVIGILQASISPVALVSGVGLLLLSLTNRFSRITDRMRQLARSRREGTTSGHIEVQLAIFALRARIIRMAVSAAVGCMLVASVLILVLFATAVLDLRGEALVLLLFAVSLVCLIASLLLFLWDMRLSLRAVQQEVDDGKDGHRE
jgi:hypothetical protein